ncbi:MAG: hypothetical protein AVDCRST_MAG75-1233 [uncultured Propionibacteriaceae bacterium]|uniref:DAGKc domain-containing protein n=1 Tax=uncultured Propionibacteriaceae bacterium TaxID=257457 RepID=A0A6J4NEE1_9ACTN|nr:MAG: hypothetical protein AVDCRST_MAG75-1233 [uncultured Propionibacteriaceae bacterium]
MRSKQELEQDIRQQRSAVLLINMLSRRGRHLGVRAQKMLEGKGFTFSQVHMVTNRKQLAEATEQALAAHPALLIVGSGDGTVSHIAARLAYQDTVLGLLPFGTTNNFARNLGIPPGLAAVNVIATGKVADVDLGQAGDRYFANVVGIGLSAEVAAQVSPDLKRMLGRTAYVLTGLQRLLKHQPFAADLEMDGEKVRIHTHQVVIANGAFHGGTLIGHDVSIDDSELAAFWLGDSRRSGFIRDVALFMLARGRRSGHRNFRSAASVLVATEPELPIEVDGELRGTTPVLISVAPEALKIMVPPSFEDD